MEDEDPEEQDQEAQIDADPSQARHGHPLTDQPQGRIRQGVHEVGQHQNGPLGAPLAGEQLNPVEHDPDQEDEEVQVQNAPQDPSQHGDKCHASVNSALVEEPAASLGDLAAVDLDAGRGQQEDPRGDSLDGAVQTED